MEIVTFSHFSNVSWVGVPFMMSSTTMRGLVNSMAAVFIDLRLLALGAEYKGLQFFMVERMLLTLCSTV